MGQTEDGLSVKFQNAKEIASACQWASVSFCALPFIAQKALHWSY